jgi:peptidoglycan/LPS O-acetylase OafA/YrhL
MLLWQGKHFIFRNAFFAFSLLAVAWRSQATTVVGSAWLAPAIYAGAIIAIILAARFNPAIGGSVARRLGLATYPLYLVHVELGRAIINALLAIGAAWSVLLGITAVIGVSFLVLPLEARFRKLFYLGGHGAHLRKRPRVW